MSKISAILCVAVLFSVLNHFSPDFDGNGVYVPLMIPVRARAVPLEIAASDEDFVIVLWM